MAKIENYICDNCGRVLSGFLGLARVNVPHISVSGKVVLQEFDADTRYRSHFFVTKAPQQDLFFCYHPGKEMDCFQAFIKMRKTAYNLHHQEALREETSAAIVRGPAPRREYTRPFNINEVQDNSMPSY